MSEFGHVQVGHPVDVGSGAVFTAMEDFALDGTLRLGWDRFYSTDASINSWLGRGWAVLWFMSLTRIDRGYMLVDERGRDLLFPLDPNSEFPVGGRVISYGANMALIRTNGYFVVEHWHFGTDDVEWFWFEDLAQARMPLAWIQNIHGHRIRVQCDDEQRPIRLLQEVEERAIEIGYGPNNSIDAVWLIGSQGGRTSLASYEYDDQGRLCGAKDAMAHRTAYVYDDRHRLVRETNALGSSFHFHYDAFDRCVHTYGDGGYMERKLRYSSAPHSTRVTDSFGNATTYFLNAAGQVIQEISPLGSTTTTEFDEYGRPIAVRNPVGGQLRYEYDAEGNRCAVVHEDGGRSEMRYNAFHLLQTYVSPSGSAWVYDFNRRGEVMGFTSPLGERSSVVRNPRGLVTESNSPAGVKVQRRYGPAMRWAEASDAVSLLTRTEYDERGNQTAIFDAQGLVQRISFDALGRSVLAQDRAGRTYRMSWNALGELTDLSGPDVAPERRSYDGFGQLIQHDNALGTIRVAYDQEGRISRIRNRANEELRWTYDADGWLVEERGFDGRVERYEYDPAGRPIRLVRADGRVVSQAYDACGQLLRREIAEDDVHEFSYDLEGSLIGAKGRFAEVILERNLSGRVVAEIQNGRRVEYTFDADGDRTGRRIVDTDCVGIHLVRDGRKRLVSLADDSGVRVQLAWDDANRPLERRFDAGVSEKLAYDSIGRLREQIVSSSQSTSQVARRYEYDVEDNLVARSDSRYGLSTFQHDPIGRVTAVSTDGRPAERYSYDANGSILETLAGARTLAAGGRTLSEGSRHYSYGLDGCISRIEGEGASTKFEHSVDGQIAVVELPDGTVVRYEYDPLGRRCAKDVAGVRTEFVWDGPTLAAELKDGEVTKTHFVFGFEPLLQWNGQRRFYSVHDQSGMVRETFDDSGSLSWRAAFDSYGLAIAESGARISPFGFRGQYVDDEVGLHYNVFRSYSPLLGDYTAPDPIGIEGGSHLYAYPRNPLQCDDPFGLKCGTAACGEKSMDGYYGQKGYKKVGAIGKNPNSNGIDAIYHKPGGKPPYIIAEAKNRGGYLHPDQHGNAQMSDAWINSPAGNASKSRLDAAFPPGSPHPAAIRAAAANGDVHTAVYNPEKNPKVTHYGTYGGASSTDPNAPPRTP